MSLLASCGVSKSGAEMKRSAPPVDREQRLIGSARYRERDRVALDVGRRHGADGRAVLRNREDRRGGERWRIVHRVHGQADTDRRAVHRAVVRHVGERVRPVVVGGGRIGEVRPEPDNVPCAGPFTTCR